MRGALGPITVDFSYEHLSVEEVILSPGILDAPVSSIFGKQAAQKSLVGEKI